MTPLDRLAARRSATLPRLARRLGGRGGLLGQRVSTAAAPRVRVDGRWLLNFASANYLGLAGHPAVRRAAARASERWPLALSQPRLWAVDALSAALECELAKLVGQERALLFSSTLHAAHDVLPVLAGPRGVLFLDACAYPISEAGARAAGGAAVRHFAHNDPDDLARRLRRCQAPDKVIVCDGLYMAEGEPAALAAFCALAERYGATLYVDDAQGLGLMGRGPDAAMPYGRGGNGAPTFCSAPTGRLVHVATLAKALGAPLAFVAGPTGFIDYLRTAAFSHIHNSPPALPVVAAALAAVRLHATHGDALRERLLRRVRQYRAATAISRAQPGGHDWPEQALYFPTPGAAVAAGRRLRRRGIWPIVQMRPADNPGGGALRLLFTVAHRPDDVERLLAALTEMTCNGRRGRNSCQEAHLRKLGVP
jgi:8-amino-7-oxononanoate synthase